MKKNTKVIITLYLFLALITFGHSATAYKEWADIACDTLDERLTVIEGSCYTGSTVTGLVSGIFWPLYWSKELWK